MPRTFTRAAWNARAPRGPYRYTEHHGQAVVHYTANEMMDVSQIEDKPAKPGPRWYKLWRTPHKTVEEKARRVRISIRIRAYNRAMRKWNLNNDLKMARIIEKEKAMMRSWQNYHMSVLGWNDIGYHKIIFPTGHIYNGRPVNRTNCAVGAHCRNANHQIGISHQMTIGEWPTAAMIDSFMYLVDTLRIRHARGHKQVPGNFTSCPGNLVHSYRLPRNF